MKLGRTALVVSAVLLGIVFGLGLYTFWYAKGHSYLTDDPAACANCHVMREQYDGWAKASHRAVAVCNDCHTPPGLLGKYRTKAENGFWHSYYFTTQTFEEPIRATAKSRAIAEGNCRRCHESMVQSMGAHPGSLELSCIRCHSSVGHMEMFATSVAQAR
jgi:cytochrome c nitrite reductase small subunit